MEYIHKHACIHAKNPSKPFALCFAPAPGAKAYCAPDLLLLKSVSSVQPSKEQHAYFHFSSKCEQELQSD